MTIKIARAKGLLITTLVASLASPGCSWILVDAPPPQHEKLPYFDCTSGNGAPIVDTILAAVSAVGAILLAVEGNNMMADSNLTPAQQSSARYAAIVIDGVVALVFAASAQSGFDRTKQCREAKTELVSRSVRQLAAPPAIPGSPAAAATPVAAVPPVSVQKEGEPCQAVAGMAGAVQWVGPGPNCKEGVCVKDATDDGAWRTRPSAPGPER